MPVTGFVCKRNARRKIEHNKKEKEMLTLPIKKKWFDMILSGEKKEEYREHNGYYFTRFSNLFGFMEYNGEIVRHIPEITRNQIQSICFRNGYSSSSPYFIARCSIRLGKGKVLWGAEPEKEYYILTIHGVIDKGNVSETAELKPCPFCGGKAGVVYTSDENVYIECKNCNAIMGRTRGTRDFERGFLSFSDEDKAIEAWNRRNI